MSSDLKDIHAQISRENWLRVELVDLPRGKWRRIEEAGINITLGLNHSEEDILKEFDELNHKLVFKQKLLSNIRSKKEEERLRLEREEHLKVNSCFLCEKLIEGKKSVINREGMKVQLHPNCAKISKWDDIDKKLRGEEGCQTETSRTIS